MKYKNIIFDLGGVILELDIPATITEFSKLVGKDVEALFSQRKQSEVFDLFEMGKIDAPTFRDGVRKLFNINSSDQEVDNAWNAMLISFPKERITFLQEAAKNHKIFLLSNTNETHKRVFEEILKRDTGLDKIDGLFEHAYYSHEMGDRKPNPSIFETVLNNHGLKAEETLFIDDSIQHIEGAKSIGLNTWFHQNAALTDIPL